MVGWLWSPSVARSLPFILTCNNCISMLFPFKRISPYASSWTRASFLFECRGAERDLSRRVMSKAISREGHGAIQQPCIYGANVAGGAMWSRRPIVRRHEHEHVDRATVQRQPSPSRASRLRRSVSVRPSKTQTQNALGKRHMTHPTVANGTDFIPFTSSFTGAPFHYCLGTGTGTSTSTTTIVFPLQV